MITTAQTLGAMVGLSATEGRRRPTLGVVAICKNEERDLPGFLRHLRPWVDEIIIVDDGSSDQSHSIIRAAGAKVRLIVSPRKSGEYYSDQRNKGIAAATSDWLLHMDIDERVTPELAADIQFAIRDPTKDGYRFRRLNFFLHRPLRGSGWHTWNQVHLARREKFHFGDKIHESCLLDAGPERIGQLTGLMWHLNDESYAERLRKSMVYAEVEAENILARGRPLRWYDLIIWPLLALIARYVRHCGYRDSTLGLILTIHTGFSVFRAYALAWDQQNRIAREELEERFQILWKATGLLQ